MLQRLGNILSTDLVNSVQNDTEHSGNKCFFAEVKERPQTEYPFFAKTDAIPTQVLPKDTVLYLLAQRQR